MVGEGEPLLLLHGFDSSFLEYRRLAPLLSERFQLFIDLFGFGFSPRPLSGYGLRLFLIWTPCCNACQHNQSV